jgi:hypothetical protein
VGSMDTHVKVLGVLYLVLSAIGVLTALFIMVTLGGTAGIVGAAADPEDARIAIPIIGLTGIALVIILLALSLPGIFAGWGLLNFRPWARILGIVLAILNLFNIPFGTILGIYALWVLLNKNTESFFNPASRSTA